jgi:replicative DNA helicase
MEGDKLTDVIAERSVLSGLYQHGEQALLDVIDILQNETFTDEINQGLYKAFKHLYEKQNIKQFDTSSIISALKELQYDWIYERAENLRYLKSIFNAKVRLDNVRTWAAQIRKLQIARLLYEQLQSACVDIQEIKGSEPISQILGIAESAIFDFSNLLDDKTNEPEQIGCGLDSYLEQIEANPVDIVGISSGMPYYDKAIGGGFRRKTVSLIGARLKVGKSILCVNIGLHVSSKLRIPVLYLDTEMTKTDHWQRLIPNLLLTNDKIKLSIDEFETGQYSKNSFKTSKVHDAATILKDIPFYYLNISGKPFEETLSIIRRWLIKHVGQDASGRTKDCLIIYDYLKMMTGDNLNESLKEYQVLGFMTTAMHNFSVRYDVPFLALTQLNRDGIDKESSDVVAGSDRVLWLATNFTVYKVKSDEEIAESGNQHGNRKLVPVCARHGAGLDPGDYINILFDGRYGKITEGATRSELKKNPSLTPPLLNINEDEQIHV